MEHTMQAQVNRGLLRFAVQTAIFCPRCQQILDMRRAVQFTLKRASGEHEGIRCGSCFDKLKGILAVAENEGEITETLDGRELFRPSRKGKAADEKEGR